MTNTNVGLNPGSSSQTPKTSPPPYTESADQSFKPATGPSSTVNDSTAGQHPSSTQSGVLGPIPQSYYTSDVFASQQQQQHHHPLFGPTPLSSQPLVPYAYYDPHSPYSLALADARARRRFLGAFIWAVCIWMLIGLFVGTEVEIAFRNGRIGGTGTWAKA